MAKNPTRGMQLRRLQTMAKGRGRGKPFAKGKGKGRGFGKRTGPVPDYMRQHMFTAIDAPSQPYNDSKVTWADQQLSSVRDHAGEINAEIGALVLEKGKADVSDTSRIAHINKQIEVLHGLIDNEIGMTAIADGVIPPPTDASFPPLMVRPTNGLPREGKVGPLLSAGSDRDLLSHPPSPLPISVNKTAADSHTSFDPMIHAAPLLFDNSSLATTLLPNGYTLSSHNVASAYHSVEPSFENGWAGLLDLGTSATPANSFMPDAQPDSADDGNNASYFDIYVNDSLPATHYCDKPAHIDAEFEAQDDGSFLLSSLATYDSAGAQHESSTLDESLAFLHQYVANCTDHTYSVDYPVHKDMFHDAPEYPSAMQYRLVRQICSQTQSSTSRYF